MSSTSSRRVDGDLPLLLRLAQGPMGRAVCGTALRSIATTNPMLMMALPHEQQVQVSAVVRGVPVLDDRTMTPKGHEGLSLSVRQSFGADTEAGLRLKPPKTHNKEKSDNSSVLAAPCLSEVWQPWQLCPRFSRRPLYPLGSIGNDVGTQATLQASLQQQSAILTAMNNNAARVGHVEA